MLNHPGINTCILNIFDLFDICTINYNICILNIFDIFDIHTINYNTCILNIFKIFDMHTIQHIIFHTVYLKWLQHEVHVFLFTTQMGMQSSVICW